MSSSPTFKNISNITIKVIREPEDLDNLLPHWKNLLQTELYKLPAIDPEHYCFELIRLGETVKPYIICIWEREKLVSMLIARKEHIKFPLRLGYLTLKRVPAKRILVFHGGFIGKKDEKTILQIYYTLRRSLDAGEADLAVVNHLHCDTLIYKKIRSNSPLFRVIYSPRKDGHWLMELPDSMETFYMNKPRKQRYDLRRKIKKVEREYIVEVKKYMYEENILEGLRSASFVSSRSFQFALDVGLYDDEKTRLYCKFISKLGWIRIYILYINNEPSAYEWGIKYGDRFFLMTLGFDPKWKKESVGNVLFQKVLKDLIDIEHVKFFDFGFGDAEYKRHFATRRLETQSLYIYSNKLYSLILNMIAYTITLIWKLSIWITRLIGIESKIKRLWKDHLVK